MAKAAAKKAAAKKKSAPAAAVPNEDMQPPAIPMMQPGMAMPMQQPQMQQPQMPMGGNPMMQMMQMMQMMMGQQMGAPMIDPAAMPFSTATSATDDGDSGLDAEIIRPALLTPLTKSQEAVALGNVLDLLCLTEDGKHALGGIPKGCTIAFAGPPGKGKTRSALGGMARAALAGHKVAFIVAEEGFHDTEGSGRDDLCSRMVKIGMAATGLSEKDFTKKVLEQVYVMESQYHRGQTWDDFVTKYRYLIESEGITFVVIDSLNMLDPSKNRTADNLSALKTYNHEKGVTCLCIGQIRDGGSPVGGEALQHTADAVFLLEEMGMRSKELAAVWGSEYNAKIDVIKAVKSVTTPTFDHPIRVARSVETGELVVHEAQPADKAVLAPMGKG